MSKKVKLLHITTVSETFNFFRGQIAYMKARGYDIHALASPGEWVEKIIKREKIPFHTVTMPRRITPLKDILAIWMMLFLPIVCMTESLLLTGTQDVSCQALLKTHPS